MISSITIKTIIKESGVSPAAGIEELQSRFKHERNLLFWHILIFLTFRARERARAAARDGEKFKISGLLAGLCLGFGLKMSSHHLFGYGQGQGHDFFYEVS